MLSDVCCGVNPVLLLGCVVHRGGPVNFNIDQELTALIEEERKLDELIQSCTWQVHQLCENSHSQRYPLIAISAYFFVRRCVKRIVDARF